MDCSQQLFACEGFGQDGLDPELPRELRRGALTVAKSRGDEQQGSVMSGLQRTDHRRGGSWARDIHDDEVKPITALKRPRRHGLGMVTCFGEPTLDQLANQVVALDNGNAVSALHGSGMVCSLMTALNVKRRRFA